MYKLELTKPARKAYLKLSDEIRKSIHEKLLKLAENPYAPNHDIKQMQGIQGYYRLRIGDWRVIYKLETAVLIIEVIKIGHRKEVYR